MLHPFENLPSPCTYARILLQENPDKGEALLRDTYLQSDAIAHLESITVAQQLRIFRNAMALDGDARWGLRFGTRLNYSSHGPLGFAALSAPTIGDGLNVFADFARSRAPYLTLRAEQDKSYFRIHFEPTMPLGSLEQPLAEVLLLIVESYVLAVLGYVPAESSLKFSYHPTHADSYGEYFSLPQQFDSDYNCVQLPLGLCAMPCPLHDQQTYQTSLARCREAMIAVIDPGDAISKVRNLLASHFDKIELGESIGAVPGLESIADTLCMSSRTLIRQLESQGSNFRKILEKLQFSTAEKLLNQSRYSVADIAVLLGYSDAANFGRAFRRWTGVSPGSYRRGERE